MSLDWDRRREISIRNQWARQHAIQGFKDLWNKRVDRLHALPPGLPGHLGPGDPIPEFPKPKHQPSKVQKPDESKTPKVGIIGAGAAGLFTAMIFDYLNSLNLEDAHTGKTFHVDYDILEAASKDRVGGRLYTYNFKAEDSLNPQGPHDYYDVGAMRFPDNPIMERYDMWQWTLGLLANSHPRLYDLFKILKMEKADLDSDPPIGSLVPYYFSNTGGEYWSYNDITKFGVDVSTIAETDRGYDPFRFNDAGDIPKPYDFSPSYGRWWFSLMLRS
jgi:hypothetical protein